MAQLLFKTVPKIPEYVPQSGIVTYEPLVSNISDSELMHTVAEADKSKNVVALTQLDVFKIFIVQWTCKLKTGPEWSCSNENEPC